jgi:hypothetical protein
MIFFSFRRKDSKEERGFERNFMAGLVLSFAPAYVMIFTESWWQLVMRLCCGYATLIVHSICACSPERMHAAYGMFATPDIRLTLARIKNARRIAPLYVMIA